MSSSPIYVFLGPTLPIPEARKILDAQYLPPASMGDVTRLVDLALSGLGVPVRAAAGA